MSNEIDTGVRQHHFTQLKFPWTNSSWFYFLYQLSTESHGVSLLVAILYLKYVILYFHEFRVLMQVILFATIFFPSLEQA